MILILLYFVFFHNNSIVFQWVDQRNSIRSLKEKFVKSVQKVQESSLLWTLEHPPHNPIISYHWSNNMIHVKIYLPMGYVFWTLQLVILTWGNSKMIVVHPDCWLSSLIIPRLMWVTKRMIFKGTFIIELIF